MESLIKAFYSLVTDTPHQQNQNFLLILPEELVSYILQFLDFEDLVNVSSVCHLLHELSNTNYLWMLQYQQRYKILYSLHSEDGARQKKFSQVPLSL